MSVLFAIFLFFVVILIIIFSMLKGLVSLFFRGLFGKRSSANGQGRREQYHDQSTGANGSKGDKVFAPDEGEYVKFEEVE